MPYLLIKIPFIILMFSCRESLADSFVAVSILASWGERQTAAPKVEEPSFKLPGSRDSNPIVSSIAAKSKGEALDMNDDVSDNPGSVSASRIDLLRDMNALFSGSYVKDSTKYSTKTEREILCELMDSFDQPFHPSRSDGVQDSRIDGSATLQGRSTYFGNTNQHFPPSKTNNSSWVITHQPISESKCDGQASNFLEKKPTTMAKISPPTFETSVSSSTSANSNSSSGTMESSINATKLKPSQTTSNPNPHTTSKVPPRISSKNFATKSLNQGAAHAVLDRADAVDAGGQSGKNFVIVHGKVVPLSKKHHAHPGGKTVDGGIPGAVRQVLTRAEIIRQYCQKNCINPFKFKDGESYLRSLTPNRRRWSHVFPAGFYSSKLFLKYISDRVARD